MFISLLLLLSVLLMYMFNTPIVGILLLVVITVLISLMTFYSVHSFWLPLIIFLMLIGGMMVLFIYMVAVMPNKKLVYMIKGKMWKLMLFFFMIIILFNQNMFVYTNMPIMSYSMMNNPLFMGFSVSYLFMFLLVLTLVLYKNGVPLRSM